jgi:hypothetical protein
MILQSDQNSLIEFLISKGESPSFSFPLDTTMFAAESKSKKRMSHVARYSRDTKLAISELAPGQLRTVDGKKMKVGGLYFEYSRDKVRRAREFFETFFSLNSNKVSMCLNDYCGWVSQNKTDDLSDTECPICRYSSELVRSPNNVRTFRMLKPEGFAPICVPHDGGVARRDMSTGAAKFIRPIFHKQVTKNTSRFSGRARLPAPDVHDLSCGEPLWEGSSSWNRVSLYMPDDESEGLGIEFVLVNTGPGGDGFEFCQDCGASLHPEHIEKVQVRGDTPRHFRPYIVQGKDIISGTDPDERRDIHRGCNGVRVPDDQDLPIGLGLRFRTDLVLFRLDMNIDGQQFDWLTPDFHGSVCAIRDAIQSKLTEKLGLMNREIGAGFRLVVDENEHRFVDIYLYDSVSGGAGLVSQLREHLFELHELLDESMIHLEGSSCLEHRPCSRACVGCLLDFKNRIDHDTINRPLGWSLFQFLQDGRLPSGNDFGIHNGIRLNRVEKAVRSYQTFVGEGSDIQQTEDETIRLPNGEEWTLISPLFPENREENIMKIDSFEYFPEIILRQFNLTESYNEVQDIFDL